MTRLSHDKKTQVLDRIKKLSIGRFHTFGIQSQCAKSENLNRDTLFLIHVLFGEVIGNYRNTTPEILHHQIFEKFAQ